MKANISILLTFAALLCTSCDNDIENRGYITKFSDFSKVIAGQTTKDEVQDLLGSPTSKSVYGTEQWIYAGVEETKETFFEPEVKNYEAYLITFNSDDIVQKLEKKGKNSLREFEISEDKTATGGSEVTVMQQLLGNLGRFNPDGNQGPRSAGVLGGGGR